MRKIKKWKKIGRPEKIFKKFGKYAIKQNFELPGRKKRFEFFFIGEVDSASIFALTKNGKVIISRQYRPGVNKIADELPAGGIDGKETPKGAILREFLEETGYKPSRVIYLGWFSMSNPNSFSKLYCFLGLGCEKVANQKLTEYENVKVVLAAPKQWLRKVAFSKITSPASIVNTFWALPYLDEKIRRILWKKD